VEKAGDIENVVTLWREKEQSKDNLYQFLKSICGRESLLDKKYA